MALSSDAQKALINASIIKTERNPSPVGNRSVDLLFAQVLACCVSCPCDPTGSTGP